MIIQSDKKLMLDFVTVVPSGRRHNEAQLITEGLTAEEQATEDKAIEKNEAWKVGEGYKAKSEREARFPLQLLEQGYSIDITKAEASREDDRKSILNCIAGGVPPELLKSQEPDLTSPEFPRVNRRLRGMFAQPAINKAAKGVRLQVALECLEEDTERAELRLDFRDCKELGAFSEWKGLGRMQGLTRLIMEEARVLKTLPDSICELAQLFEVDLKNSKQLASLPPGDVNWWFLVHA